jgi:hypothetical protein
MPNCLDCPAGFFQNKKSSTSCTSCQAGTACKKKQILPYHCPSGWISTTDESTICIACSAGKASFEERSTRCTTCFAGTVSNADNSSSCHECETGRYSEQDFGLTCKDCPQGWAINATSSPACEKCPLGNRSIDVIKSTGCTSCVLGEIQPPNTRKCHKCYPGYYSFYAGEQLAVEFAEEAGKEDFALCHSCPEGAICRGGHRK